MGVCGGISGFLNAFVVTPVELVKIKLQLQKQKRKYKNSFDCFAKLLYKGGPKGTCGALIVAIFQGLVPTIVREIPSYFMQFLTYELLKTKVFGNGAVWGNKKHGLNKGSRT